MSPWLYPAHLEIILNEAESDFCVCEKHNVHETQYHNMQVKYFELSFFFLSL